MFVCQKLATSWPQPSLAGPRWCGANAYRVDRCGVPDLPQGASRGVSSCLTYLVRTHDNSTECCEHECEEAGEDAIMIRPGREPVGGNSSQPIEGQREPEAESRRGDLSWQMIASRHRMDINRAVSCRLTVQASQAILQCQGLSALFGATLMLHHNGIHPNL
jgi:hypothetical protein